MKKLTTVWLPVALLAAWSIGSGTKLADPLFLPAPWAVAKSLFSGLSQGAFLRDWLATVARSLSGFALASVVGVPLGLLVGRIPALCRATQPTIDFFRSVPATALFPLFLFFFGLGDTAKIAIVIYACSLIVLVNTAYGARQVKVTRILSAKVMGAGQYDIFWKIVIPESAPGIFAGLRVALSLSFVLIVVTEMFIGTTVGLGYQIMNAQMVYRIPEMYAGIILAGFTGYIANVSLLSVEHRLLHWVGR
jgi:ABC-type nitrate/sulfonate/bicarbonate transport system permease component